MKARKKTKVCLTLLNDNLEKLKELSEKRLSTLSREVDLMILREIKEAEV